MNRIGFISCNRHGFKQEIVSNINRFDDIAQVINVEIDRFPNSEFKVKILGSVQNKDIFIVQDVTIKEYTAGVTINDNIIAIFLVIDACNRAGAKSVNVFLPYFPYSRQDKKYENESLSLSVIARFFESLNVKSILTIDMHSQVIENVFTKIRFKNLDISNIFLSTLQSGFKWLLNDLVIVAPDVGAINRNRFFALMLNCPLIFICKERNYSKISYNAKYNNIVSMKISDNIEGKNVFIYDDILDTGGTLIETTKLLKDNGAKNIVCAVSFPLFNENAIKYFDKAYKENYFSRIIGTNAVYHNSELLQKKWYSHVDIISVFVNEILNKF